MTTTTLSGTELIAQIPNDAPKTNGIKVRNDCFATIGASGNKSQKRGIEKTSKAIREKLEAKSTKKKFETNNDMAETMRADAQISRKTILANTNAKKHKTLFVSSNAEK